MSRQGRISYRGDIANWEGKLAGNKILVELICWNMLVLYHTSFDGALCFS